MTGFECCLLIKHKVRDLDMHGRAIQCHLDYDKTTCKKKYLMEQANKKVFIYANHKDYVSKEPKITNTWPTCSTKWGKTRDWSEKHADWSYAPTPSAAWYAAPTPPPTLAPSPYPTGPPGRYVDIIYVHIFIL